MAVAPKKDPIPVYDAERNVIGHVESVLNDGASLSLTLEIEGCRVDAVIPWTVKGKVTTREQQANSGRVPGHTLRYEGAPFGDDGLVITHGRAVLGIGGTGRAKCSCGEFSEVLLSSTRRRKWHREHKAAVLAGQATMPGRETPEVPSDEAIALAWHDITCPEGTECRSRRLHAQSDNMVTTSLVHRLVQNLWEG